MELKKYKLGEIANYIGSGMTPLRNNAKYWNSKDYPWLKTEQLGEYKIFDTNEYVSKEAVFENHLKIYPKNTISIAMYGEGKTRGSVSILANEMTTNQACCNLILNNSLANNEYVYYFLKNSYLRLRSLSSGIRKNLNSEDIKNFEISLPPLQTQQKIAAVLSALDDKIALNRRINAKLEAMTKRLYDYWFVQFDFPTEDGKPYKSSGGKMEYNEVIKREIPAGWEVKLLGEVCNFPIDRVSEKNINGKLYVPIEVIPRNEMSFSETANIEKAASGLCSFDKRSILLSNRRVYFHKVCIAPFGGITRDTVIIINPEDLKNLGFIYQIVNSNHFIDYATLNSYGSEQPVLSTPTVQDYKFVCPNMGFDKTYSEKVNGIINKVLENNLEIRKLTAMRDRLLPLLMNGQIEVK